MTVEDYGYYDVIKVMDLRNLCNARLITDGDPEGEIPLLLDKEIEDPWCTDDFQTAYKDILEGCKKLLKELI